MLSKYELSDHVLTDITPDVAADPHWRQMDCTICSWLYGIVAPDLIEIASTPTLMARSIWLRLQEQFIGNCETHALIPDVEFHNFIQGNLSISDYCCCIKGMADALSDLREVVHNHSLVLTTLCGLNIRFSHMAAILNYQRRFLTFAQVPDDLQLEEIELVSKPGPLLRSWWPALLVLLTHRRRLPQSVLRHHLSMPLLQL
jgi:hypothetical protein